jgi:hypothetical protein
VRVRRFRKHSLYFMKPQGDREGPSALLDFSFVESLG